jgi:hypothetical protein
MNHVPDEGFLLSTKFASSAKVALLPIIMYINVCAKPDLKVGSLQYKSLVFQRDVAGQVAGGPGRLPEADRAEMPARRQGDQRHAGLCGCTSRTTLHRATGNTKL